MNTETQRRTGLVPTIAIAIALGGLVPLQAELSSKWGYDMGIFGNLFKRNPIINFEGEVRFKGVTEDDIEFSGRSVLEVGGLTKHQLEEGLKKEFYKNSGGKRAKSLEIVKFVES